MKKIILTGLLSLAAIFVVAQDTPEKIIEKFFQDYEKEQPDKALDNLYAHMTWGKSIQDDLDKVKIQFVGLQKLVGNYLGYVLITKKSVADSFVLFSYLVKFDRQPVRFEFKFYKPTDKWVLYGFAYDDKISEELEESAKLFYLDLGK